MAKSNTYRIYLWVIVILLATNLSMGVSFLYHKQQDKKIVEQSQEAAIEIPAQRRTRFFMEQLNLRQDQMDVFRQLNRNFNQNAWQINHQLEDLRIEMVTELGKENPEKENLDSIALKIGSLHSELKEITMDYYLNMKKECDEEQKVKLNDIFMSVLQQNEDVKLPQNGRNRFNRE